MSLLAFEASLVQEVVRVIRANCSLVCFLAQKSFLKWTGPLEPQAKTFSALNVFACATGELLYTRVLGLLNCFE